MDYIQIFVSHEVMTLNGLVTPNDIIKMWQVSCVMHKTMLMYCDKSSTLTIDRFYHYCYFLFHIVYLVALKCITKHWEDYIVTPWKYFHGDTTGFKRAGKMYIFLEASQVSHKYLTCFHVQKLPNTWISQQEAFPDF